jgi:four helix bundle protein
MYHRDLKVWQQSIELVKVVYDMLLDFPANEQYGLASQLRRAVVSIPSNIAEGCGRETNRELYHFLNVASGSLAEVETQVYIAYTLGYIEDLGEIDEKMESVQKLLAGFRKHIKTQIESKNQIVEEV